MKLALFGISSPLVLSTIVRCNQIDPNEAKDALARGVHGGGHGGGMQWGRGGVMYPVYGYGGGGYVPAVPVSAVPVPAVPISAVPAVPGMGYGYAPVNPGYVIAPGMRYPGVQPALG